MDLRERVVAAIEAGASAGEAAERFEVGRSTAGAWARLKRATGAVAPGRQGQPEGSKLDAHEDFILALVAENRDITLAEIAERLMRQRGVQAAAATVWYFFDRRGITFKKRLRTRASRSATTSPLRARPGARPR
jgi:transposase